MDTKLVANKIKTLMREYGHTVLLHFCSDTTSQDIEKLVNENNGKNPDIDEYDHRDTFVCTLVDGNLSIKYLPDDLDDIVDTYKNFVNLQVQKSTNISYRLDSIFTEKGFNKAITPEYIQEIQKNIRKFADYDFTFRRHNMISVWEELDKIDLYFVIQKSDGKLYFRDKRYTTTFKTGGPSYSFVTHGTPVFKECSVQRPDTVVVSENQFYDEGFIKV